MVSVGPIGSPIRSTTVATKRTVLSLGFGLVADQVRCGFEHPAPGIDDPIGTLLDFDEEELIEIADTALEKLYPKSCFSNEERDRARQMLHHIIAGGRTDNFRELRAAVERCKSGDVVAAKAWQAKLTDDPTGHEGCLLLAAAHVGTCMEGAGVIASRHERNDFDCCVCQRILYPFEAGRQRVTFYELQCGHQLDAGCFKQLKKRAQRQPRCRLDRCPTCCGPLTVTKTLHHIGVLR